jgi:hypothetical protein
MAAYARSQATLFSFGYWGCGSATRELVEAIDAVEARRGFGPPLWVDVRMQRSVRASGFRDDQFEKLLKSRYVWIPNLGNTKIQDGGTGVKIKKPSAAAELLDLALRTPNRRVIFFCACPYPHACHRRQVGQLLLRYARARQTRISVIEWPGGDAGALTLDVSPASLRKIERKALKSLPIPPSMTLAEATSLPWGTIATLQAGESRLFRLIGPARFDAAGAHIQLFPEEPGTAKNSRAFRTALAVREMLSAQPPDLN